MNEGSRHQARERAFALLYEAEVKERPVSEVMLELLLPLEPYAQTLLDVVNKHEDEINKALTEAATDWALDRMPAVDRNVLRVALAELLTQDDVPVAVIINEAVELAKEFSTEESGKFINGVLSTLAEKVRS